MSDWLVLLLGLGCIALSIRAFWYFKKGWGIRVHLLNDEPYYAGEKPLASKSERANLFAEGLVLLVLGIGITLLIGVQLIK